MAPDSPLPTSDAARAVLSVSELNRSVGKLLERTFPLVLVRGEVSNFTRAASGHWYFVLKDESAQVRCAMFRGRAQYVDFPMRDGDAAEATAQVRLYEARGEFQLVVDAVRKAGVGGLLEAFERLKQRLANEGLFDEARKRTVPPFVRCVGIVTSPEAAALHDVARALAEHAPHVRSVVYPTPVQGEGAAARIADAIALANRRAEADVLIVCRGGGSIEDLWAFNEEIVARAIVGSALPVVVGVGHESDTTIADFAADVRAPTPTAAARAAVISRAVWLARVDAGKQALSRAARRDWERASLRLDFASARLTSPHARLESFEIALRRLEARLGTALRTRLDRNAARVDALRLRVLADRVDFDSLDFRIETFRRRLRETAKAAWQQRRDALMRLVQVVDALSPRATLRRGYAIVEQDARLVTRAGQLAAGEPAALRFFDGTAQVRVETVAPDGGNGDRSGERR